MKHPGNKIIRIIGVVFIGLSLIAGSTLSAYATDGLIADKYASEISEGSYDHDTVVSDALRPSEESHDPDSQYKSDENYLVGARYRDEIVSFAQSSDDTGDISDALNPYSKSEGTGIYPNASAAIDDAQTGALIDDCEVEAVLYKGAEREDFFEDRPVKIKISGRLPEECSIEAYPVIFTMEGYDVIEAWNVTIFDKAGNVYEPGDNPVKVTISSDSLRQLSRGEVEIYHIATKDEFENSLTGSNDRKDTEQVIPEEKTEEEETFSEAAESGSEEEDLIIEAAQSIDEDLIAEDDEPQEEIVGAALSLTEEETEDAFYNETEDEIAGEAVNDAEEEVVGASDSEDEWLIEDAETFSAESIEEDAPSVDMPEVIFAGVEVTADDGTTLYLEKIETVNIGDWEDSITFDVNEFSGIAAVRADEPLLGAFVQSNNAVDTSDFLEINLFNYTDLTNTQSGKGNMYLSGNNVNQGINLKSNNNNWNNVRDFRFYSYGIKKDANQVYTINNYTGGHGGDNPDGNDYQNYPAPVQGIVQDTLYGTNGVPDADGYPILTYHAWNNGNMPAYATGDMNGSLAYLFTEDGRYNGQDVYGRTGTYNGLNRLFYIEDGMYTYDSHDYYAYYNTGQGNNGNFELRYATNPNQVDGFFPFDRFEDNNGVGPGGGFIHHFGMTMTANFYITQDGLVPMLDSQANPIVDQNGIQKTTEMFTFTGDDDLWVFIDGKLVLDVGGVHQPVDGTINFKTGEITVNNEAYDNNLPNSAGREFKNAVARVGDTRQTLAQTLYLKDILGDDWNNPYNEHTIKLFYIERGSNDSNLMLQFNFPATKSIDVSKKVTGNDADLYKNEEFRFQLFLQNMTADSDSEVYEAFNPYAFNENLDEIYDLDLTELENRAIKGYHENSYLSKVKIYIGTENPSTGVVTYPQNPLTEAEILERFDEDGVFKLKHGEHIKFSNLLEIQKYYVKEFPEGDRFEPTANAVVNSYQTEAGLVSENAAASFENRTIKRQLDIDKEWEDVPYADQPDSITLSVTQKDYVRVHFSGSAYDSLAASPVMVPKGEPFSFKLAINDGQQIGWNDVRVTANGDDNLNYSYANGIRTYTIPGSMTTDPVDVCVEISPDIEAYNVNPYTDKLNTYAAEDCLTLDPLEYVNLHIDVTGSVYNSETEEYETVEFTDLGGDYAVLKAGGDELDVSVGGSEIGYVSLSSSEIFRSLSEQGLAGSAEGLISSGAYEIGQMDGDATLTIQLKGGQETTAEQLKQAFTYSLTDEENQPVSTYTEPTGNVRLIEFPMNKPAREGDPWHLDIVEPNKLNEQVDHYYKYSIDELYVTQGGVRKSLTDAGYKVTVDGPEHSILGWPSPTNLSRIGTRVQSFDITNKPLNVDITLIKTSSVELPQEDGTTAYEILPNIEFTLYEKTIETVMEEGEEVEKVILTPVNEEIVSDSGETTEQNEEAIAEAAARKGKIFLNGLARGKTYYLKETKAAEGYFLPGGGWTIAVGADGKITISGEDNYAATYEVPTEGEFAGCYRISNVKMYSLPSTGGPGNYMFTIIGIAISALIVMLKLKERKEGKAA